MQQAPPITGLLETVLYCRHKEATAAFYERALGLPVLLKLPRVIALQAGAHGALLLFDEGKATGDLVEDRGTVPGHDGSGPQHFALAIPAGSLEAWRARLAAEGVELAGEYRWPRGGVSLYFHDPDGHVGELATPGLWPNY